MSSELSAAFWDDAESTDVDRYRTLVNAVNDGIYQLDATGHFVAANDRLVELSNYSRDDILGEHVSIFLDADDISRIESEIQTALSNGTDQLGTFEVPVTTADGETIYCELQISLLRGDDGEFRGTVGVVRDTTDRKELELALREQKQHLETRNDTLSAELDEVYGRITDGFFALNDDWEFTYINEQAESMLGVAAGEVLGERIWDAFPATADTDFETRYRESLESQEVVSFEGRCPVTGAWYEERVYPSDTGVSVYFRDVTDQWKKERELELFREIIDQSSDAVFVIDPDTGRFLDTNGTAARHLNYSREELLRMTVMDIDTEMDDLTEWQSFVDRLEAEGELPFDGAHTRNDGSTFPVEINAAYVTLDRDYVLAISRDVTERKQLEQDLRESERRFRQIAEHLDDCIWLTAPDYSEHLYASPAYEDIWGRDPDELENDPCAFLNSVHPDDRPRLQSVLESLPEGEYDETYRIIRPDGTVRWVRDRATPIEDDDGNIQRLAGITEDITEQKAYEAMLTGLHESATRFLDANTPTEVSEHTVKTAADLLDLPCVACYRYDSDDHRLVPDAHSIHVDFCPESLPDLPTLEAEGSSLLAKTFRDGSPYRFADDVEPAAMRVNPTDRDLCAGAYIPLGEHGVLVVGGCTQQVLTEQTYSLLNILASHAQTAYDRVEYEQTLEQYKEYTDDILDAIDDVFYVLTDDFECQRWNDAACEVTGYSDAEFAELNPLDCIAEDDREDAAEAMTEVFETGSARIESAVQTKSGETIPYEFSATVLEAPNGDRVLAGIGRDISARKAREQELAKYETIVEAINDGIYVKDTDGYFTMVNDAYAELTGYDREELVGAHSSLVVDEETIQRSRDKRATSTDRPAEQPVMEAAIETANGESIPAEATFSAFETVDGGQKQIGVVRDISDRKEQRRKLAESEQRYRALVDHFPNGAVGLFNENLEYTIVGGEMFEEVGEDREDIIGATPYDRYPDEFADEIAEYYRAALNGESNTFEAQHHGRDWRVSTVPVTDDEGDIFAGMVMAQDTTERKEYRRQLETSNERLENFAHAASHDLQEPLRMVSSYLQLLDNRYGDALDDEAGEFLDFAVNGADRMREMVDALLQYSRVETRGEPLHPTDLNDTLTHVEQDLQLKLNAADATLTTESLPTVACDENQIRQVLQNLIDNAIKYSGDTPPEIRVDAEQVGAEWQISVHDNGIGIPEDSHDKIFQVFDRLHSREEHEGTGIGLSLCERIIERHGGEIWVESEPGEGSTFSFTLPAANVDPPTPDHRSGTTTT